MQIINRDRSSDRQCTSRGVGLRACLYIGLEINAVKTKRVYKRKLMLSILSSTLRSVLIARLVEESCKTQEKQHIDVSISVIDFVTETLPERCSGLPYIKHNPVS